MNHPHHPPQQPLGSNDHRNIKALLPPQPSQPTPGDDTSTIASNVSPTQQQNINGSDTTAVNGSRAGPETGVPADA